MRHVHEAPGKTLFAGKKPSLYIFALPSFIPIRKAVWQPKLCAAAESLLGDASHCMHCPSMVRWGGVGFFFENTPELLVSLKGLSINLSSQASGNSRVVKSFFLGSRDVSEIRYTLLR